MSLGQTLEILGDPDDTTTSDPIIHRYGAMQLIFDDKNVLWSVSLWFGGYPGESMRLVDDWKMTRTDAEEYVSAQFGEFTAEDSAIQACLQSGETSHKECIRFCFDDRNIAEKVGIWRVDPTWKD